ncbi:MAG TPA: ribonuclease HI [Candidatus Paceibacterota bacterium]
MSITIFTDGSSRGNPGPGGWGAIVRTESKVTELGGREDHTTNNRMELLAAISALDSVVSQKISGKKILVQSDSKYVIQGITSWVSGWKRNGWITAGKKEVGNRDLWEALSGAVASVGAAGNAVSWKYVEGHAGHPGNERCDEIATTFADKSPTDLYAGARDSYPIDLDAAPAAGAQAANAKKKSSSSVKAYSYLSLVDGVLQIHKTWAECEARVKGVRGTKFKKSISAADEAAIRKEWGV